MSKIIKKKTTRVLPWIRRAEILKTSGLSQTELQAKIVLDSKNYACQSKLPNSFTKLKESFKKDGTVDAKFVTKARSWILSVRKRRNEATLYFDELWNDLFCVAKHLKASFGDGEESRNKFRVYSNSIASIIEPLLTDNLDGLTWHDFGGPFSTAQSGCVEAAWKGEHPYTTTTTSSA
jgi:hypothetical protein